MLGKNKDYNYVFVGLKRVQKKVGQALQYASPEKWRSIRFWYSVNVELKVNAFTSNLLITRTFSLQISSSIVLRHNKFHCFPPACILTEKRVAQIE